MQVYIATIGPSATLMSSASFSSRPSHFLVFLFVPFPPVDGLSPPKPNHNRPSAVPAAKTPVVDIAIDMTKGGDNAMPPAVS